MDNIPTQTDESLYTKAYLEKTDKGMLAVASTSVEDRHGEVVDASGWDIKNFKKNPVLQWAHDPYVPAIGIAKNIHIEGLGKKAKLVFEPIFHEYTEFARAIKAMYEAEPAILNSFSVGFRPYDIDGNRYVSQELLEISAVNVPANPEARVLAYKSLKGKGFSTETLERVGFDTALIDKFNELEAALDNMRGEVDNVVKGLKYLNPQGRNKDVVTTRQAMLKVIVRSTDHLLRDKQPVSKTNPMLKVIKRTTEKLILDHKQELQNNGKNQRP